MAVRSSLFGLIGGFLLVVLVAARIGPSLTMTDSLAIVLGISVTAGTIFCFRNIFVRWLANRARFSRLYWADKLAARGFNALFALFLIVSALLFVASKVGQLSFAIVTAWFVVTIVSFFCMNLASFLNFFREDGETYLCLRQALVSSNYGDGLSWLFRGITGVAKLVNDAGIDISSRKMKVGITIKLIRGKPVTAITKKLAKAVFKISTRKQLSRGLSSDLLKVTEEITSELDEMKTTGVGLVPSYSERITSLWETASKSGTILTGIIYVGILLLVYAETGKIIQTIIP